MIKKLLISFIFFSVTTIHAQTWNSLLLNPGSIHSINSISSNNSDGLCIVYMNSYKVTLSFYNGTYWKDYTLTSKNTEYTSPQIINADSLIWVGWVSKYYFHLLSFDKSSEQVSMKPVGPRTYTPPSTPSFAFDEINKRIYVAFYDGSATDQFLKYIEFNMDTDNWINNKTIDPLTEAGINPCLVKDDNNDLWVSYYEKVGQNLKLATNKYNSEWVTFYISTAGNIGQFSKSFIDDSGFINIIYYDATNQELKQAKINTSQL